MEYHGTAVKFLHSVQKKKPQKDKKQQVTSANIYLNLKDNEI